MPLPTRVADRVSVVVLNWNSGDLGERAVASVRDQDWPDVEIIVVDNDSTDDSLARITRQHGPHIAVVRNDQNLGFGPGMNAGIAVATGAYVVPLNCDAELDADYITTLVAVLDAHPRACAAGGSVRSDRVGVSGPLAITQTMRTNSMPTDQTTVCDKVNGACPLFRRAALDQVVDLFGGGPYDPSYAMYGEDVDLALTLARLGWEYRYEPGAGASHVRSFSSAPRLADRRGPLRISTLTNRHRNIVRHADHWVAVTALAVAQDIGFAALQLLRRDVGAAADVAQSIRQHLGHLGADRRRRAALPPRRPPTLSTR